MTKRLRQSTVLSAGAIRQARENWMQDFEALAAYANLGDTPDGWQQFRLSWPNFFSGPTSELAQQGSDNLAESLYAAAQDWNRFCSEYSARLPVDYRLHTIPLLLCTATSSEPSGSETIHAGLRCVLYWVSWSRPDEAVSARWCPLMSGTPVHLHMYLT